MEDRRYIVCRNAEQAHKDAADRQAILVTLEDQLRQGSKSLVGNRGYRRYLKVAGEGFQLDRERVDEEARYDGRWVLSTNTDYPTADVAYKQLWMVEDLFRSMKSILSTRPIYHRRDETIRGHVFCSFRALLLRTELQDRLCAKGFVDMEWGQVVRDLDRVEEIEIDKEGRRLVLRTEAVGVAGKAFQAVGVALPPPCAALPERPRSGADGDGTLVPRLYSGWISLNAGSVYRRALSKMGLNALA